MTQKELAELVGVKHNSVSTWESGANAPDIEIIFQLSDIFGVSVSELYGQEPNFQKSTEKSEPSLNEKAHELLLDLEELGIVEKGKPLTKAQASALFEFIKKYKDIIIADAKEIEDRESQP